MITPDSVYNLFRLSLTEIVNVKFFVSLKMSGVDRFGEASIKVIPFTGNKRDWPIWSEKFLARADIKGYRDILLGEVVVKTDFEFAEIVDEDEKHKAEAIRRLNKDAYIDLLLSIGTEHETGRVAFQIIRTSKTKELSSGDARAAWLRLESKFESKRAPNRLLLKEKFMNMKLKNPRADPDVWITQLEDLQVQINSAKPDSITEDELIEHILGNLPSVYDIEIHTLRKRLDDLEMPLTIEEVREELNLKFEMMNRRFRGSGNQDSDETALFAGGFKGKCHSCGKFGHRARDCSLKANNAATKTTSDGAIENSKNDKDKDIQCFYCKKKGHRIADCLKLKKKEQANIGVDTKTTSDDEKSNVCLGMIDTISDECAFSKISSDYLNIFIADSGASCHMVGRLDGMTDLTDIDESITVGNGQTIKATKMGTMKGTIKMPDGTIRNVSLKNCKYVPQLAPFNLFSITHALRNGFNLGNDKEKIFIQKGDFKLLFDHRIETKTGYVVGAEITPNASDTEFATPTLSETKPVDVNEFHKLLGHPSESKMRFIAKYYGVKLTGKFEVCTHCAQAKARQANIPKEVPEEDKTEVPGERLHMDISSIKARSFGGAKYWLLIIDEATGFAFSYFLKRKNETAQIVVNLIKHLHTKGKTTKYIRCDNAGENLATERLCNQQGLGIDFEYTAPNSPQQNGRVERRFATLYGRVRSMLNAAQLNQEFRKGLWAECARTATYLDNQDCENSENKRPRFTEFYGRDDKSFPYIRRFGEVAVVKTGNKIQNKLENRGEPALYLGHAEKHSDEVSRFLKLTTKRVIRSRDARWLDKTFLEWTRENGNILPNVDGFDYDTSSEDEDYNAQEIDIPEENESVNIDESDAENTVIQKPNETAPMTSNRVTRSRKFTGGTTVDTKAPGGMNQMLRNEMRRLGGTWFNPEPENILDEATKQLEAVDGIDSGNTSSGREDDLQAFAINTMAHLFGDYAFVARERMVAPKVAPFETTENIDYFRRKIKNIHILDALDILNDDTNDFPSGIRDELQREIIITLKDKLPGCYKEAWDHPDPKFREKWRNAFTKELESMKKRNVWKVIERSAIPKGRRCVRSKWVFDIKRSGLFKVRLVACGYTQVPGVDFTDSYAPVITDVSWRILILTMLVMNLSAKIIDVETAFLLGDLDEEIYMTCREVHDDDKVLLLLHSIYGLVQAARQYYKKFISALRDLGFKGGYPDPCLMTRQSDEGLVYIAIWVDDSLLVGDEKAIDKAISDLRNKGFTLKVEGSLKDYLSCEITLDRKNKVGWIHQPHLVDKLESKFGHMVKSLQNYRTPGTPGQHILRNLNVTVDAEKHAIYRSGVGMLLYLVKHSRPDIANAVRELTKALDGPSPAAYKEFLRVMKHTIDTKDLALKMKPNDPREDGSWTIIVYCDSDYAGDTETRVSIAGFVIYLLGVPISWKSKGMKSVTLSSSEAEYVALSEAAKEIKFVYQVLLSMGIKVETPIIVRVDNVGAIFIAENVAVSQRTKHIDVRYRFVQEFVLDGFLKIIFVRTEENDADIFTKNVGGDLHDKHRAKMVDEKQPAG